MVPTDGAGREPDAARNHYERIRDDLLTGVFPPGTVLAESALTERYGISRTPVREALARLEQDDLLERVPRGHRVRAGTFEDVLDIYEARIALEQVAAAAAAMHRTRLELARLERLHKAAAETDDLAAQRRLDARWHAELWVASHNRTVVGLLHRLTAQLRVYDVARREEAGSLALTRGEHEAILAAVRDQEPEAARAAVLAHLGRSRDLRLDAFAEHAAAQASPSGDR